MTELEASVSLMDIVFTLEDCIDDLREAQKETESTHTINLVDKWVSTLHKMIIEVQEESDRLYPIPIEEMKDFMSPEEIAEEMEKRKKWEGIQ